MSPNPTPSLFSTYYHYLFLGGPGGLPLVISLSPLASIYKTSKQIFTPHLSLSPFVSLPGGVPQSYSITLLLTAITIPWGVQGVSPWLILSSSCFNLHNHNTDINTPFVPFPLSIPPWGVSPQSFYHYFLLTTITIPWGVQGVSPWLFLSISCINLQNLNRDIHTPFFPLPLSIPPWGVSPQSYSIFFFFTYYHYYSLVQGVWVQGVSPWLILSFSCFNLQNLNTYIKRHILSPPW